VNSFQRVALLGVTALLASGCSHMGGSVSDSLTSSNLSEAFKDPKICAAAGALLAGGVGAVENREAAAIGAVAGGLLGWWACRQQESAAPDADGDGVPNKIDACPDTPGNTKVQGNGCPVDADSDMDGVPDSADKCSATPKGAAVDATGCEPTTDTDGDGVTDAKDMCPNTAGGAAVMSNGCELDTDSDGVPDSRDRCAGTPAGVAVGADGCAADSDGDGVSDLLDRCSGTPAGTTVDSSGCAASAAGAGGGAAASAGVAGSLNAVPAEYGKSIVLKGVTFQSGSARISRDSLPALDDIAEQLKQSGARVEVSGHTDTTGSATVNRALSQRRAEVVMTYLASKGIPVENMTAKGYGPDAPVADNASASGRAKNRRVELKVLGRD
jgi:outer membrane protein OmpA-like peptidoglycan-associated protein